ncbi:hypothetical protein CD32_21225 [Lysinibacillus odysseyi 34hs-1 = NBRC 100172]|uniref:Uncharacterized protein n=1 Tax=Lysinibacillus odysseyi 34hs-1 = NBRC 100172 TaxID=1220589 RepID=A0A0A3J484_9BACI|nr:hypothetical protein CD32_21225 [Lysinibacillus odysseyi 34hs-1 = NBRC 100172]
MAIKKNSASVYPGTGIAGLAVQDPGHQQMLSTPAAISMTCAIKKWEIKDFVISNSSAAWLLK